jgi:hypothetical protein
LNSEVAQTAETLYRDEVARERAAVPRGALNVVIPAHSSGAASTAPKLSGIATSASTGATMYCW